MANIGGLATFADRIDVVCDTIESIKRQLDLLFVYCNDEKSFKVIRKLVGDHVKVITGANITDRGKFFLCSEIKATDNYYFSLDDDIIYPCDYVQNSVKRLKEMDNQAIISYHGKVLSNRPITSYYKNNNLIDYRVLDFVSNDTEVDIIGTGCAVFHLQYFCPERLILDNIADVEVSLQAKIQGKKCVVLKHKPFRYNEKMKSKWTIWDYWQTVKDTEITNLINKTFV